MTEPVAILKAIKKAERKRKREKGKNQQTAGTNDQVKCTWMTGYS